MRTQLRPSTQKGPCISNLHRPIDLATSAYVPIWARVTRTERAHRTSLGRAGARAQIGTSGVVAGSDTEAPWHRRPRTTSSRSSPVPRHRAPQHQNRCWGSGTASSAGFDRRNTRHIPAGKARTEPPCALPLTLRLRGYRSVAREGGAANGRGRRSRRQARRRGGAPAFGSRRRSHASPFGARQA